MLFQAFIQVYGNPLVHTEWAYAADLMAHQGTHLFRRNHLCLAAEPVFILPVVDAGDAVRHRTFGPGTVQEVTGAGGQQKVRIRFEDGAERTFSASAAPIMKVGK